MIKFKIQGLVFITFLAGESDKYHFTVKEAKGFSMNDPIDKFNLIFEISKKDGQRLLEYLKENAKKTFEKLNNNPLVINGYKNFIHQLSKEVE